jgi:hypothetical protein
MFISSENYLKQLSTVIQESSELSLAVAFWGNGADKKLQLDGSKSYRIICNLATGGTNPKVIEKLRKYFGEDHRQHTRQLDNLHAKVSIGINPQNELIQDWQFLQNGQKPLPIKPLQ